MDNIILNTLVDQKRRGQKQLAVLLDPDKASGDHLKEIIHTCKDSGVDYFLVGGSLLTRGNMEECIAEVKGLCDIPVIIFPGNVMQVSDKADGILLLSLISGRNPDLLIGKHVVAAPLLKKSGLEVIPTGYILVDGGNLTSVAYMSNTLPIPADKADIAVCTAMAGEMLGLKVIYMDAGSGAKNPIPEKMIRSVSRNVDLPLFIGGGIRTPEQAKAACDAGADIIVIGNAAEKDASLIKNIAEAIKQPVDLQ